MKQTTVLAPVIDLKRGSSSDERQITDAPPHVAAGLKVLLTVFVMDGYSRPVLNCYWVGQYGNIEKHLDKLCCLCSIT